MTEECNLTCKYCYITQSKGVLSISTYEKFLEYLINNNLMQEKINIIGGEPLLYPERVKEIVSLTKKKVPNSQIIISTNLSLDYEKIKEILEDPVIKVSTSLDGTEITHNRIRGSNSFELVTDNLRRLAKVKKEIRVVYTFDPDFEQRNFIDFVEILFKIDPNPNKWRINIRPASPKQNFQNCGWFIDEMKKLTEYWINKSVKLKISFIASSLKIIKMKKGRGPPCELGEGSFRLGSNGDIWPCTQYFILKDKKIGNINLDSIEKIEKARKKLILFKKLTYEKFYEKDCNCFFEDNCNRIHCLANFEKNNYKCYESRKVSAKMAEEIVKTLKENMSIDELNKINLEEDYED